MTRALDEVQAQLGTEKQDHACCALKIMLRLEILQNAGEKTVKCTNVVYREPDFYSFSAKELEFPQS